MRGYSAQFQGLGGKHLRTLLLTEASLTDECLWLQRTHWLMVTRLTGASAPHWLRSSPARFPPFGHILASELLSDRLGPGLPLHGGPPPLSHPCFLRPLSQGHRCMQPSLSESVSRAFDLGRTSMAPDVCLPAGSAGAELNTVLLYKLICIIYSYILYYIF